MFTRRLPAVSAREYLNRHYLSLQPKGTFLMVKYPKSGAIAELQWLRDSLPTDYNVILDIRNESAVAGTSATTSRWENLSGSRSHFSPDYDNV